MFASQPLDMPLDSDQPENARNDNQWAVLCPELIYEILAYCLLDTTLDTCSPNLFPWYLGQICRSWRSVFTSSPRFWDRFKFDACLLTGAFKEVDLECALTLVELCVKRTKDRPFSFRFNAKDFDSHVASYMSRAMKTIVANADRWSAAYFKVEGFGGLPAELLLKAKHRFGQSLHTLQVSIPLETATHPSLFEDAPNLTRVFTIDYYHLRWSSLTVLHIEFSSHASVRLFAEFDKMKCLEELVIRGAPQQADVVRVFETPVKIPSLKILYVQHYYPLTLFRAPSLEILHLADVLPVLRSTPIETFTREVNHLRTLSFNTNLYDVLRWIPELDHAIVIDKHFMLMFLLHRSLARSLKSITVGDTHIYRSGTEMLCDITSVIWEKYQFPNLRRLSVFLHERKDEDMSSAINNLVRLGAYKGFEVDVKFSSLKIMPPFGDL